MLSRAAGTSPKAPVAKQPRFVTLHMYVGETSSATYIRMYTYIYIYIYICSSRKPSGRFFHGFRRRHHPTCFYGFRRCFSFYGFRRRRKRFCMVSVGISFMVSVVAGKQLFMVSVAGFSMDSAVAGAFICLESIE